MTDDLRGPGIWGPCSYAPLAHPWARPWVRDLNSSLRVLEIKQCFVLMIFTLFESCKKIEIEPKSWLPNVKLTIHECPHLMVSNRLPPSSSFCKLSITKVSTLPEMEGSLDTGLRIGPLWHFYDQYPIDELMLDKKQLSFHNLRTITRLEIMGCKSLCISILGLRQLVCLRRLKIWQCSKNFSSDFSINASPWRHGSYRFWCPPISRVSHH
jgi:hypothetical protein